VRQFGIGLVLCYHLHSCTTVFASFDGDGHICLRIDSFCVFEWRLPTLTAGCCGADTYPAIITKSFGRPVFHAVVGCNLPIMNNLHKLAGVVVA